MEWSLTGVPLPIVLRPPSPLTDDELLAFSRKNRPFRIEKNAKGEIEIMTPVGGWGSNWEAITIRELGMWAEDDGRGIFFSSNGGFNLPDGSMLSPDASWVSYDCWNVLTPRQQASYPPLCPDFLIEILYESDLLKVLQTKMEVWMANGAQLAWMVDPYAATITIYRPNTAPEVLQRPDSIEADAPVAGFRLTTSRLWADEAE
jgi:Uma2 family endonuclease